MAPRNITPQTPLLEKAKASSRRTGIPYGSLRDIAHRGELPVIRVGRAWYFAARDVDNWIETRKERAG